MNGSSSGLAQRVTAVEVDINEIKLEMRSLASEMRASFVNVGNLIAERQRTPWVAIFTAAAVVLSVIGFIGSLALQPIQGDLTYLKNNLVTRNEQESRESDLKSMVGGIRSRVERLESLHLRPAPG
jgi:hypothetical protein